MRDVRVSVKVRHSESMAVPLAIVLLAALALAWLGRR
jgi:MYXO-CTERM domain-containing protein